MDAKLRVYVRASNVTPEQNRDLLALDFCSTKYHKSLKCQDEIFKAKCSRETTRSVGSLRDFIEIDDRDTILSLATKDVEQTDVFVILTPNSEFIHHSVCIELGAALVRKIPILMLVDDGTDSTDRENLDVYARIYGVWLCDGWESILKKLKEIHRQRIFERRLENGDDFTKRYGC